MGKVKKGSYIYIAYDRGDGLPIVLSGTLNDPSNIRLIGAA